MLKSVKDKVKLEIIAYKRAFKRPLTEEELRLEELEKESRAKERP